MSLISRTTNISLANMAAPAASTGSDVPVIALRSSDTDRRHNTTLRDYSRLLNCASVGIYTATPEGDILLVNRTLAMLLGFRNLEDLHENFSERSFNPYADSTTRQGVIDKLGLADRGVAYESHFLRADGSTIAVREDLIAHRDANGRLIEYQSFVTPIDNLESESRRAEIFQSLVAQSSVALFEADADGQLLWHNHVVERILSVGSLTSIAAKADQKPKSLIAFDDWQELMRELSLHEIVENRVLEIRVPSATPRWICLNLKARETDRGKRIHGIMLDVTEAQQAQSTLEHRIRAEKLINTITTRFITIETADLDVGIRDTLLQIAQHLGADRASIVLTCSDGADWSTSHQWQKENTYTDVVPLSCLPLSELSWLREYIIRQEVCDLPSMDEIGVENPPIGKFFRERGIESCLIAPMCFSGAVVGLLIVDARHSREMFPDDAHTLVRIAAEITTSSLEQRWTEETMRRSEQKLSMLLQQSPLAVVEWDRNLNVIEWNRAAERIFGYRRPEIIGRNVIELFTGTESRREAESQMGALLFGERANRHTSENIRRDGRAIICEWHNTALLDRTGTAIGGASMAQDVTKRKEAEARLLQEALHDALTGLPNRAFFTERLQRRLRNSSSESRLFAVLFLDLDRFKIINDSLGHLIGDRLLIEISRRLEASIRNSDLVSRKGDTTVARLGGDEFTILLDDLSDEESVNRIADRIQQAVSEPCMIDGHKVYTTASIGIVFATPDYTAADDLLRDADLAMYEAKGRGKAQHVVFDQQMRAQAHARLETEMLLRRAVERREFAIYYQPIVQYPNGKIQAVEALVRWKHPKLGLVGPNEFLALAEETGLILPIGEWVLEEACTQFLAWKKRFPSVCPPSIHVNLSRNQFNHSELVSRIKTILQSTRSDPRSIAFEVAESEAKIDANTSIRKFAELHEIGLQLCIDDFGTGCSSLANLHRLPASILKVDRTFIGDMTTSPANLEIVRAIISLARNLGKIPIAKGVESSEQAQRLAEFGCILLQGNYFHPPMSSEELTQTLDAMNLVRTEDSAP